MHDYQYFVGVYVFLIFVMYIITVNPSLSIIFTYLVLVLCIYVIVPVHTSLLKPLYIYWFIKIWLTWDYNVNQCKYCGVLISIANETQVCEIQVYARYSLNTLFWSSSQLVLKVAVDTVV